MTDWLGRLLGGLGGAGVGLSPEDVADVVWLAGHLGPPAPAPEGPGRPGPSAGEAVPEAPAEAAGDDEAPDPGPAPEATTGPRPSPAGRRGSIHLPGGIGEGPGAGSGAGGGGRSIRVPTGSALPGSLALSRALRPLRRRVPSRARRVLDVAETVRRIAEGGPWVPALRPARDRWLDLALVVDEGASMGPWRSAAAELLALLSALGAFRSIRAWGLDLDAAPARLRAGLGRPDGPRRDPRELVDPAGRTLVVALTDCVAGAWSDGRAAGLLDLWGRGGPVAVIQVLPEHLWARSGLGLGEPGRVRAPGPAAANARLAIRALDPWAEPLARPGLPVPVVSLVPRALGDWSRLVAGAGGAEAAGYRLDLEPPPEPPPPASARPPTPRERLDRFWGVASPTARRLAGLLAASPSITLPVIRLVRQAMLPEARQVHEAEVLLGDLLRVVDAPSAAPAPPDEVRYDFRDGVRGLLLDALPTSDALDVLGRVSAFVEENLSRGVDFLALLADPATPGGAALAGGGPFARVAAEVLLRLGGDYARLVTSLPEGPPVASAGRAEDPSPAEVAPPPPGPPPIPAAASAQHRIVRARPPRVQITFAVEVEEGLQLRELPFVIGVLADLSGRASRRVETFASRRLIEVDRDNFDEVMAAISPRIYIPIEGSSSGGVLPPMSILTFSRIDDFRPESIAARLPELAGPWEDVGVKARDPFEVILGDRPNENLTARFQDVEERARQILLGRLQGRLREILHDPEFRRLEATWRGLHRLVGEAETGPHLKIRVLDASKAELARDLEEDPEFGRSALFRKVHDEVFDVDGGEPFGLLVGDYEFTRFASDVSLLGRISRVAAAAHAPFVAAAGPPMFGLDSFDALPDVGDLAGAFAGLGSAPWWSFRDSEEARHVALVLPRVLGRLPYRGITAPITSFPFEEWDGPAPREGCLWVSAAWALAGRVAGAMSRHGWPAAICGPEAGRVGGLPSFPAQDGADRPTRVGPVEVAIDGRPEYELASAGFIGLVRIGQGEAAFLTTPTCQRTGIPGSQPATAAAERDVRLEAVLCVSRFVQAIVILAREKAGTFGSAEDCRAWLDLWISRYVAEAQDPPGLGDARYPLSFAEVQVREVAGPPGRFRAALSIQPTFQLATRDYPIRATFLIPGGKG